MQWYLVVMKAGINYLEFSCKQTKLWRSMYGSEVFSVLKIHIWGLKFVVYWRHFISSELCVCVKSNLYPSIHPSSIHCSCMCCFNAIIAHFVCSWKIAHVNSLINWNHCSWKCHFISSSIIPWSCPTVLPEWSLPRKSTRSNMMYSSGNLSDWLLSLQL